MIYTTEEIDRSTGDLREVSLGDWLTVTELGTLYGVGSRKIRTILHHMGLLRPEGQHGSYRLTPHAVAQGLGKRIGKSKSGWPFDVLSPRCQELIDQIWEETLADLECDLNSDPHVTEAQAALATFKAIRQSPVEAQQEVCWMKDHYPGMLHKQVATVLDISPALVTRYAEQRRKEREFHERRKAKVLPEGLGLSRLTDESSEPDEREIVGEHRLAA